MISALLPKIDMKKDLPDLSPRDHIRSLQMLSMQQQYTDQPPEKDIDPYKDDILLHQRNPTDVLLKRL